MTEQMTPERLQGIEDRMNTPAMYEVSYTEVRDLIAAIKFFRARIEALETKVRSELRCRFLTDAEVASELAALAAKET